ncbi:MAG: hypothetical protein AB1758_37825, partial [Candidatus Eremiobacterota bacterium]
KEVFGHFILTALPPGLAGLLVAAVLSVVLSTFESALTALAGSFVVDLYRPHLARGRSEAHYVSATRWATLGFCALLAGVAVGSENVQEILKFGLEIGTYSYGALLAVFAYALAFRRPPPDGLAWLSLPASVAAVVGVKLTTTLAFPWFVAVGTLTGFAVLALASLKPSS